MLNSQNVGTLLQSMNDNAHASVHAYARSLQSTEETGPIPTSSLTAILPLVLRLSYTASALAFFGPSFRPFLEASFQVDLHYAVCHLGIWTDFVVIPFSPSGPLTRRSLKSLKVSHRCSFPRTGARATSSTPCSKNISPCPTSPLSSSPGLRLTQRPLVGPRRTPPHSSLPPLPQ